MKKTLLLLAIMVLTITCFAQKGSGTPKPETLEPNDVIERINAALSEAQSSLEGITLQSATVSLETTYDKSGGGGFKIFVKASRKWAKGSGSVITYKYEKPLGITSLKNKNNELVAIIKNAAKYYKENGEIAGLKKDSFEIEVSFSITKTTGGGVEFEVYGVGFDGEVEWERKVGHTVSLEFK